MRKNPQSEVAQKMFFCIIVVLNYYHKVMKKKILFIFTLCLIASYSLQSVAAQIERKQTSAQRTEEAPVIDGILNEAIWKKMPVATDFYQIRPYNGEPSNFRSEVRLTYDNMAVYVAATLYDPAPDSIMTGLSRRDEINASDYFGIYIDPYNDGLNAYGFFVTASGVQVDMKSTTYEDNSWDAVWESAVTINDEGWVAEFAIPYSALRFPKQEMQKWGVNMFRNIQRRREHTSWNFINSKIDGVNNQAGILEGVSGIEPPVRLSVTPYFSAFLDHDSGENNWVDGFKGGANFKYGINESFTLDMMLIPDFGQVQSDDERLNLTAYETYYGERRPFFMEGTELFNKAGIFYSRRIGGAPSERYDAEATLNENEEITETPGRTQLLNASKITGKTQSGLSIGLLNAMSQASFYTVEDTATGEEREVLIQPFTNYNILVADQSLPNNSSISFINSNVSRAQDNYMANVSGTEFRISTKNNAYTIEGKGAISQIYQQENDTEYGHYYEIEVEKTSGNFRFGYEHRIENDTYDPNDLGYLQQNNEMNNVFQLRYNIYKPFWKMLRWYNTITARHNMLHEPRKFSSFGIGYNTHTTFRNHFSAGMNFNITPMRAYDHYESNVEGRRVTYPKSWHSGFWISSDYRKTVAIDFNMGLWRAIDMERNGYWGGISPRWRVNDKVLLIYRTSYSFDHNDVGYIDNPDDETIYFGARNRQTYNNVINANYVFNNKSSLSLRIRHYWSRVKYNYFYLLAENGDLNQTTDYTENEDINYNAFNIDMVYTWNFAPGSELLIVWKNGINTDQEALIDGYFDDLRHTLRADQNNTFSIKILYYLDYLQVKNSVSRINSAI